jgi:hypothetical protein
MRSPVFSLFIWIAMFAIIQCIGYSSVPFEPDENNLLEQIELPKEPSKAADRKQMRSTSSLLNTLIADPTVPVFLMMGLASIASILTAVSSTLTKNKPKSHQIHLSCFAPFHAQTLDKSSENEIHSRRRRSVASSFGTSGWSEQTLHFLHKLEKAVQNYQAFETDILSDLNASSNL